MANLFVLKMFVNDLWAAGEPAHRRGHPLLTAWWLAALMAFGSSGAMLGGVPRPAHAEQACDQMQQVILSDGFFIVLALLTAVLVRRLSRTLQRAAFDRAGSRPPGSSPRPAVA